MEAALFSQPTTLPAGPIAPTTGVAAPATTAANGPAPAMAVAMPSPLPMAQTVVETKPAEKKDEKKPTLDAKYKALPWLIFGVFLLATIALGVVASLRPEPKPHYGFDAPHDAGGLHLG